MYRSVFILGKFSLRPPCLIVHVVSSVLLSALCSRVHAEEESMLRKMPAKGLVEKLLFLHPIRASQRCFRCEFSSSGACGVMRAFCGPC